MVKESSSSIKKKKTKTSIPKDSTKKLLQTNDVLKAEIDDLFTKKIKKNSKEELKEEGEEKLKIKSSSPTEKDSFGDVRGLHKKATRLTDDGLPIWTDKEMKIGQGGDSPDCPFDCECCF